MKVFVVLLLAFVTNESVFGQFEDYYENFADKDAYLLAQEDQVMPSILDPPKELYEKIHKELDTIRTKYPVVADVYYQQKVERGKLYCRGIDLYALNASSWGPIEAYGIAEGPVNDQHYGDIAWITLNKPYYIDPKMNDLLVNSFADDQANVTRCWPVENEQATQWITRVYTYGEETLGYEFATFDSNFIHSGELKHRVIDAWWFSLNGTEVNMEDSKHFTYAPDFTASTQSGLMSTLFDNK